SSFNAATKSSTSDSSRAVRSTSPSAISSRARSAIRRTSSRSMDIGGPGEEAPQHFANAGAEPHGELEVRAFAFGGHHNAAAEALVEHLAPHRVSQGRSRAMGGARLVSPTVARPRGVLTPAPPRTRPSPAVPCRNRLLVAFEHLLRNLV